MKISKADLVKLVASILICQIAGFVGSYFTAPNIATWYASLQKPTWSPPNWLFAPVWITLYLLMGISVFLVWRKGWKDKDVRRALPVFDAQLALNVLWSILFFGLQSPFDALMEIIGLWVAILATIILFYKVDKKAAYLLIPYIIWVSIAAFLNYNVWLLNA